MSAIPMRRAFLVAVLVFAMFGPAAAAPKVTAAQQTSFDAWLADVAAEAKATGISETTITGALGGLTPNLKVLRLDATQPEYNQPPWGYLDSRVGPNVKQGRAKKAAHAKLLAAIEKQSGVDADILMAIWGIESNFGGATGSDPVLRTLATIGWMGKETGREKRAAFGRAEVLAALRILEDKRLPAKKLRGSWAGAMGFTQVIPTSFLKHGTDFDGDGAVNLWAAPDALATAAELLKADGGWKPGLPWGVEVVLPKDFDFAHARLDQAKTVEAWTRLGVAAPGGKPISLAPDTEAWLMLPAGHTGPALLVTANFHAILEYNYSIHYALAVGTLADRIAGRGEFGKAWPRKAPRLKVADVKTLQEVLARRGHDTGGADGKIGLKSRQAIRAEQQRLGLPADAWPTQELLDSLRDAAE